jgi:Spy/CpxP family protein refolding chaperone
MKSVHGLFFAATLLACAPAIAAPNTPAAAPAGPMAQRLQKLRSRVLRDKVGLTDDKAVKVEAILDRYAPERRKVALKLRDGRQKLKALMVLNSEDQGAYRSALDEIRTNRKALQDLMARAFDEIAKELTPKEQGRLFLALDDLRGKGLGRRRFRDAPGAGTDDDSEG